MSCKNEYQTIKHVKQVIQKISKYWKSKNDHIETNRSQNGTNKTSRTGSIKIQTSIQKQL